MNFTFKPRLATNVTVSLLLISATTAPLFAMETLKSGKCEVAVKEKIEANQTAEDDQVYIMRIPFDKKKVGGGEAQRDMYEFPVTGKVLKFAQEQVNQIVLEQIKPLMNQFLLGNTDGREAQRMVTALATRLLIGEDLNVLATSEKSTDPNEKNGSLDPADNFEKLFEGLVAQKDGLLSYLNQNKGTMMTTIEKAVPGAKLVMSIAKKLPFSKAKSLDEVVNETKKERDIQIDVAKRVIELTNLADQLEDRLKAEIGSVSKEGSPLLEANGLLLALTSYRQELEGISQNDVFIKNENNKQRMKRVVAMIDQLIGVSRQNVNDTINVNDQKQATLISIEMLRSELQFSGAQYIKGSMVKQATATEMTIAQTLGDGIEAMNEGHKAIIEQSKENISGLLKTLKKTETYRLENHQQTISDRDALGALVSQVEQTSLRILENQQKTAILIGHEVATLNLLEAMAVPGNEEYEAKQLQQLVENPLTTALANNDSGAIEGILTKGSK